LSWIVTCVTRWPDVAILYTCTWYCYHCTQKITPDRTHLPPTNATDNHSLIQYNFSYNNCRKIWSVKVAALCMPFHNMVLTFFGTNDKVFFSRWSGLFKISKFEKNYTLHIFVQVLLWNLLRFCSCVPQKPHGSTVQLFFKTFSITIVKKTPKYTRLQLKKLNLLIPYLL